MTRRPPKPEPVEPATMRSACLNLSPLHHERHEMTGRPLNPAQVAVAIRAAKMLDTIVKAYPWRPISYT